LGVGFEVLEIWVRMGAFNEAAEEAAEETEEAETAEDGKKTDQQEVIEGGNLGIANTVREGLQGKLGTQHSKSN
jgi:hypothetical protein